MMLEKGRIDGVFMWWDLEMDKEGEIVLSCAPRWSHPTPRNMQVGQEIFTLFNNARVYGHSE